MNDNQCKELQEYIETIELPFEDGNTKTYQKISMLEVPYLAAGAAAIVEELRRVSLNNKDIFVGINTSGKGKMTAFKDGSGFMGSLRENGKWVGQEHFFPLDSSELMGSQIPLLASIAAVAITVGEFEKQIVDIQTRLEEIKSMLRFKEDSEIEACCEMLLEALKKYKDGRDRLDSIEKYKGVAIQKILYYKKLILSKCALKKTNKEDVDEVLGLLEYYVFSLRVYALASFLEVIYSREFDHGDIMSAKEGVYKKAQEYFSITQSVQLFIEKHKKSIERKTASGVDIGVSILEAIITKGKSVGYSAITSPGEMFGGVVAEVKTTKDTTRLNKIQGNFSSEGVGLKRFDYLDQIMNEKYGFLIDEEYLYLAPLK